MRCLFKLRYLGYYLSSRNNMSRCSNSLSQGARSKPSITEKKQLSLGCNGAPGSPGSLEMIPHVLLASTWQTNLNESESLSSYPTSANQMFRQKKNRPHFPIRRWWEVIFCSSVIPKPHSWKPEFIYHCFAWLLEPSTTCLKTVFTDQMNRACIFKI